jgi:hypothetical protein
MATGLSAYLANKFLDAVGNATAYSASNVYVKLHIGDPGAAGTANRGGGGGGGGNGAAGGTGGSGIVIIRYPDIYKDAVSTTNGTKTTYTGYKVYTFLSSGSIMF